LKPDDIVKVAGGNLAPVPAGLAKRAESVGSTLEEAEVAISEPSQNLLDDMAAMLIGPWSASGPCFNIWRWTRLPLCELVQ
jgi:hypothetical protein